MIKATIFGIGGVGAAHALSLVKWCYDHKKKLNLTMVDLSRNVINRFSDQKVWTNSWGCINDSIEIDSNRMNVRYIHAGDSFCIKTQNIAIIATPTPTHEYYRSKLDSLTPTIIEKPICEVGKEWKQLRHNEHYGIEWLYHPNLENVADLKYKGCYFVHGWKPLGAGRGYEIGDLGSHVLSVLGYLGINVGNDHLGPVNNFYSESVSSTSFMIDKILCQIGYNKAMKDDTLFVGDQKLDWIPFEDNDLFYRQIDHVLSGKQPLIDSVGLAVQMRTLSSLQNIVKELP